MRCKRCGSLGFDITHKDWDPITYHFHCYNCLTDVDFFRPEEVIYFNNEQIELLSKWKTEHKILLVEDGSIDIDDLEEYLEGSDIKIVTYRQGSKIPIFLDLEQTNKGDKQ